MRTHATRGAFGAFLLLAVGGLAGCLGNPVKDMPDLGTVSIGAVTDERGREQPVDKLDGDPVWERGKTTWDDSRSWRLCQ